MQMLASLLLWLLLVEPTQAQTAGEPPRTPFLQLDTGMHSAVINRISVDSGGRLLATASDDKTIRLWSLSDGAPLATLRVPIGPGEEGALYSVALAPDGKRLVAAGFTAVTWDHAVAIYLFDVNARRLIGRLPNQPEAVNHLAFSADGKRIAAAFSGHAGVRVWDSGTGRLLGEDRNYGDRVTWVAFDGQGRLASASFDGQVRIYDGALKLVRTVKAPGGKPFSVAFSPDGSLLAVGYADRPRVDVLASGDLSLRFTPDMGGYGRAEGALNAVCWQLAGSSARLLAAGSVRAKDGRTVVRSWRDGGHGQASEIPAGRDTVTDLERAGDSIVFATADPAWGRIDGGGKLALSRSGAIMDFRGIDDRRLAVSTDGASVEFSAATDPRLRFELAQRRLTTADHPDTSLAAATTQMPGIAIAGWRNGHDPTLDGRKLALESEEIARSLAILPDGQRILLGTDYYLRLYDRSGAAVSRTAVPAAAWGVAITPDGKTAVAALGDGTIRWYGIEPGETSSEKLALFIHRDLRRWIAWTPEGFFDHADSGGKELVGYLLNRGKAEAPEWVGFAQLYRLFYSQELVAGRLHGSARTEIAARIAAIGDVRRRVGAAALPKVELVGYCIVGQNCSDAGAQVRAATEGEVALPAEARRISVRYAVTDRGSGIGDVDFFLNDRNVGRDRLQALPSTAGPEPVEHEIALEPGLNRIQLRAYDGQNGTYALSLPFLVRLAETAPGKERPRLFIVAVGIDRYRPPAVPLRLAATDAKSFVATVQREALPIFREVRIVDVYDEAATADGIDAALRNIAGQAQVDDTVLIYFAGHGRMIDGEYYFITQDVDLSQARREEDIDRLARPHSLTGRRLVERLGDIRAKNGFVFLDTCYAGALKLDTAGSRLNDESGRYVLTATASVEEALDSYDGQNGLFAYAVIEGLRGKARRGSEPEVNNIDLGLYVVQRVDELANEKKHRQSAHFKIATQDAHYFPLGRPE